MDTTKKEVNNDIIDLEETKEGNFSSDLLPAVVEKKRKGILSVRYRKIASLAVRGWSPVEIGREMGLRPERVTVILERDDVWQFVIEEIRGLFSEGDRMIASLYKKAMVTLDEDLSSADPNIRKAAREQVLRLWGYGKNQPQDGERPNVSIVQQFLGGAEGGSKPLIQSMDEIILQKRKERGLKTETEMKGDENEESIEKD